MIGMLRTVVALCLGAVVLALPVQAQSPELGPTLGKIASTGAFYVAVREDSVPFSYVLDDKQSPAGYSWEICKRVAKAVEARLGKTITTIPVIASSSGRMMMVKAGMADIECGATGNTVGRQRQVAFSHTFYVSEIRLLVRAGSGINSEADLDTKRVVTTSGSNAERLVRQLAVQRNISFRHAIGQSNLDSMQMLERGEVDAFVNDDSILLGARANARSPEDFVLLPRIGTTLEPYGLVMRNDDPEFKKLVDATLVELFKSGEIEQLYDRWFNQPIPPAQHVLGLPLSDLNKAAFANPNDKPVN